MKILIIVLLLLAGCTTTTTAPDGSVTESRESPAGFIKGSQGKADWCATVKIMGAEVASACFQGERKANDQD